MRPGAEKLAERYDVCNAELSRIVSFDSTKRSLIDRFPGTLLRPIVIDGPLIGVSYDRKYSLDERIRSCKNYVRRPKPTRGTRRGFETMAPYPIQALVKILFHFIARGHKATAYLPIFFNERLNQASSSDYTLVSNGGQFRELVNLKLIRFLPGENFANHLKHRTADCQGILVTTQEAFYFDGRNNDTTREDQSEEIAASAATATCSAATAEDSCDLMYSTKIPEILIGKGKLPVIIPLFRPYNHRLIISLDVIRWKKVLEVGENEVSVQQYNTSLRKEQLTLQMQFDLLSKLAEMMDDDDLPCGRQDAEIVPLIQLCLRLVGEETRRRNTGRERGDEQNVDSRVELPNMETKIVTSRNPNETLNSTGSDLNLQNTLVGKKLLIS